MQTKEMRLFNYGEQNAFPCSEEMFTENAEFGLNKREYFAAMALQGLLANSEELSCEQCAKLAVRSADYLLEQLDK